MKDTATTVQTKLFSYKVIEDSNIKVITKETQPTIDKINAIQLKADEIIYLPSDETTHLWVNSDGDTVFVFDAGCPILVNGLSSIISDSAKKIKAIKIFISHFHHDHVQAMASFIVNSKEYDIVIHIHEGLVLEFMGWLLDNYPHLVNGTTTYCKIMILRNETYTIANTKVKGVLTNEYKNNSLKHFTTSATYLFGEKDKCVKVFSGDINPPSPRPSDEILGG